MSGKPISFGSLEILPSAAKPKIARILDQLPDAEKQLLIGNHDLEPTLTLSGPLNHTTQSSVLAHRSTQHLVPLPDYNLSLRPPCRVTAVRAFQQQLERLE